MSNASRRASTPRTSTRRSSSASTMRPVRLLAKPRRGHGPIARLYRGETRFDFVGQAEDLVQPSRRPSSWLGIVSIILRGGLNLGIEFKGGTEWTIAAPGVTQTEAVDAMKGTGLIDPDRPAARHREQADAQRAVRPQQALAGPAGRREQERAEGAARADRAPCPSGGAHDHDDDQARRPRPPPRRARRQVPRRPRRPPRRRRSRPAPSPSRSPTRSASPPSVRRGARPSPTRPSRR